MLPQEEYFKSLPRKRISAAVLVVKGDTFLAVQPAYKDTWEIPGGIVENGEDPLSAARRECQEEIGVTPEIAELLCIDFQAAGPPKGDGLHFIFLARIDESAIRPDQKEIKDFRFIDLGTARGLMTAALSGRIEKAFSALRADKPHLSFEPVVQEVA
jgi:8-oxo-dGTP diphosphatase